MPIEPFSIPYSQSAVDDLRARIARTRWLENVEGETDDWGLSLSFLREICDYWQQRFDWKSEIDKLNRLHHYKCRLHGEEIHFIHAKGRGPNPIPIILTHGWPGSFLEMLQILPLLTDPASHGGDAADSFDVVVPSMPGYGFSSHPGSGMNTFRIAELWVALMEQLGYRRFAVHGEDIGASVSSIVGLRHADRAIGVHLNYIPGSYRPFIPAGEIPTPEEQEFLASVARWYDKNGAYAHMQGTRPRTAAQGLNDCPVGLAAWILEKFRDWSDCNGDLHSIFSFDFLLSNVTLYWMTQTVYSSFRPYHEGRKAPLHFGPEDFIKVPCAIARFPKEEPFPPKSWVERGYNIQRWTEMPRGGHFAAMEQPELLAEDIRSSFRTLRDK